MEKEIEVLSLGMGVQSTALYYMSSMGSLPRANYAVFADLGKEKKKTYEYLDFLLKWQSDNNGIEIIVVNKKNLYKDILNNYNSTHQRFVSIPAYTKNEDGSQGMLRRQCTSEYKIKQVDMEIRIIHQLQFRQRVPKTIIWKGITLDEWDRMSEPREVWKTAVYPFCGYRFTRNTAVRMKPDDEYYKPMTRLDVIAWYKVMGLPVPPKSSCIFCPYQSEYAWYDMKINEPEDFAAAVEVDERIRDGCDAKIKQPAFLHESLKPLKDVQFKAGLPDLWHGNCASDCHT